MKMIWGRQKWTKNYLTHKKEFGGTWRRDVGMTNYFDMHDSNVAYFKGRRKVNSVRTGLGEGEEIRGSFCMNTIWGRSSAMQFNKNIFIFRSLSHIDACI